MQRYYSSSAAYRGIQSCCVLVNLELFPLNIDFARLEFAKHSRIGNMLGRFAQPDISLCVINVKFPDEYASQSNQATWLRVRGFPQSIRNIIGLIGGYLSYRITTAFNYSHKPHESYPYLC